MQDQDKTKSKKKKRKRKKKQRTESETESSVTDCDYSPLLDIGTPGVYDRTKRDKCLFDHLVPKNSDGTPNSTEANKATEERLKADEESPLKNKMIIEPSEIFPFETDENCYLNVMHFEAEDGIMELRLEEKGHDGFIRRDKKFDIVIKQWHPYSQKFKDVTTLGPCFCGDHKLGPREFYYKPSEHRDKWESKSERNEDMVREAKDLGLKEDVARNLIANLPDNFDFGDETKRRNVASFSTDENKKKKHSKCSKCNVNLNIQLTDDHEGAEDRQNFTKEVQEIYNNNTREPQVNLPKDVLNKLNQDNNKYTIRERLRKKLYEKQRDSGKDKGPEMQSYTNPKKPTIPPHMDPEEVKKIKRAERGMEKRVKENAHATMEKQRREIEYLEGKQRKRRQAEREKQKRDMEFEKQKQKTEMKKMFEKLDDDRQKYVELLKTPRANNTEVPVPTLTIDIDKYMELLKKTEKEDREKVAEYLPKEEQPCASSPPICTHKDRPQYHTCGHACNGHHHLPKDDELPDEETMKRMVALHKLHKKDHELAAQYAPHHIYSDCSKASGVRASQEAQEGTDDEPILPWCRTAKRLHEMHKEKEFLKKNPDLLNENRQTADYLINLHAGDEECAKKKKDQKVAEVMNCQCSDCKRPEPSNAEPKHPLHEPLSAMLHEAYSDRLLTSPPRVEINMTPNKNPARSPLPHERTMGPVTSLYHNPNAVNDDSKTQLILGVKVREDNSLYIQPIEKTPGLDIHDSNTWPKLADENVVDIKYHKDKLDQAKIEAERNNLRKCSKCNMREARPKSFKKCSKCKSEGVKNAKYYCTRGCQVADWGERHKMEHRNMNRIVELVD
ncbi:unnamed protein product [Owenia fusiformis]|uniref:Uncharacterized protein n=1 Tax=Owenia fusiformis TaxID=6347 RepID=A0A8J1T710_OWEFU|nr:unnamed protein product [Owenia fusiformis]